MTDVECEHPDFVATVDVGRMEDTAAEGSTVPRSFSIDVKAQCANCGVAVRFYGPIGVAIGPGTVPMVSFDGLELHASGHLGDPGGDSITARFQGPS